MMIPKIKDTWYHTKTIRIYVYILEMLLFYILRDKITYDYANAARYIYYNNAMLVNIALL